MVANIVLWVTRRELLVSFFQNRLCSHPLSSRGGKCSSNSSSGRSTEKVGDELACSCRAGGDLKGPAICVGSFSAARHPNWHVLSFLERFDPFLLRWSFLQTQTAISGDWLTRKKFIYGFHKRKRGGTGKQESEEGMVAACWDSESHFPHT